MIAPLIHYAYQAATFLLFARILMSWIPHDPGHPISRFLIDVTDPMMRPFQNILPPERFGIDLSPIFAFIALRILKDILMSILV